MMRPLCETISGIKKEVIERILYNKVEIKKNEKLFLFFKIFINFEINQYKKSVCKF
jgi:hypothetical protein